MTNKLIENQLLLIFLLFTIISCSPKSKEDETKKIKDLKEQCEAYEQQLDLLKNKYQRTTDSLIIENQNLEFQIDSVTSVYNQTVGVNLFHSPDDYLYFKYTKDLPIQEREPDNYWNRGEYYTSKNEGEMLYHVTTGLHNDSIHFFFMGITSPNKMNQGIYAKIYELNELKEVYVVDSFRVLNNELDIVEAKLSDVLKDFLLNVADNMLVKEGRFYYYKPKKERDYSYSYLDVLKNRDFYEYSIGSKEKPIKMDNFYYSSNIQNGVGDEDELISPSKSLIVSRFCSSLYFYEINNWSNALISILGINKKCYYKDNINYQSLDFNFRDCFEAYADNTCDCDTSDTEVYFDIGGLCWHSKKDILYFDNSGACYACIWKVDIDNERIEKIVPEHEAIQPHFFSTANQEYVAYVEENKIMLCKVPGGFE